jgi:hypothetical protein
MGIIAHAPGKFIYFVIFKKLKTKSKQPVKEITFERVLPSEDL